MNSAQHGLSANVVVPRRTVVSLVQRSWDARYEDQKACYRLAVLASHLADVANLADLRALAYAHKGNAERLCGFFALADASLRVATREWIAGAAEDKALGALILEFRGSLYDAVRDFESALVVLRQAEALRSEVGNPEGLSKVQIQLGIVLGYSGDLRGAITALRQAIRQTSDPDLLRFAVQPLVRFYTEAGEPLAALEILNRCGTLMDEGPELYRMKTEWHRALVGVEIGQPEPSCLVLADLRQQYLSRSMRQEAAFVSLDLAVAYLGAGRHRAAREALCGVEALFTAMGIGPEALCARALGKALFRPQRESVSEVALALLSHQAHPGLVPPA